MTLSILASNQAIFQNLPRVTVAAHDPRDVALPQPTRPNHFPDGHVLIACYWWFPLCCNRFFVVSSVSLELGPPNQFQSYSSWVASVCHVWEAHVILMLLTSYAIKPKCFWLISRSFCPFWRFFFFSRVVISQCFSDVVLCVSLFDVRARSMHS